MRHPLLGLFTLAALVIAGSADALTPRAATKALLRRPPSGTVAASGFRAALYGAQLPRWPVALRNYDELQKACGRAACDRWDALELALQRAAHWMAAYSESGTRFDAAVALSQIRQTVDSDLLRKAFEAARTSADRDHDHPHRRFWKADMQSPPQATSGWKVPAEAGQRTNVNNVLHEALFCKEHGWRRETMHYVCGPMRDEGGYHTTHAAWALAIAHDNGCLQEDEYTRCARSLQDEMKTAQPADFRPKVSLDVDLYAERALQTLLTGSDDPIVDAWVATLLKLQNEDGSWGMRREGEDPYFRYHATMMSAWTLSEWYRRLVAYPQLRTQIR